MSEVKDNATLLLFMIFFPWIAIFIFPIFHYIGLKIFYCMRSDRRKQERDNKEIAKDQIAVIKLDTAKELETDKELETVTTVKDQAISNEQAKSDEPYYTGKDAAIYDITLRRLYSLHCNIWVWLWVLYFIIAASANDDEYVGTRAIGNIYGYILIPLLTIYMCVEAFFCLEYEYLGNILEEKTCKAFIKELTETRPAVFAKSVAFHFETRYRQVPYTIGGNTYYRTEAYQEKVIDDEDLDAFSFARWEDVTPDPETLSLESSKLTRINLTKSVTLGDEETQEKFNELLATVEAKVRAANSGSQIESFRESDISGFKEKLLAYWELSQPRWWVNKRVFVVVSFLWFSWVYRFVLSFVSQKAYVTIEKKIYWRA